jgi:hypothetical protein
VPVAKCVFQRAIKDVNADFEKTLDGIAVPPHLLPLRHAFSNDLVDGRFSKAGRNPQVPAVTLAIVRHGISVELQLADRIEKHTSHLPQCGNVLETSSSCPLSKMHQAYQTSYRLTVPKAPFRAFEFSKRMATNGSVRDTAYALGKLFQILKSHADVEPSQHVLALWCNLAVDRAQASIAIGEDGHRSVFVYSAPAERQTRRFRGLGTSIAYKRKTRCVSLTIQRLARDNFKISFRSPMRLRSHIRRPGRRPLLCTVLEAKKPRGLQRTLQAACRPS